MSNERKAYVWSGVVKSDLKVEVGPAFGRPGGLVNLSIKSSKTYRDDIDGVHWTVYCDNRFDVKISHKGKLLMLMQGEEVQKYWYSTLKEAVESIKNLISEDYPAYYIYKEAENYYSYYMSKLKYSNHQLVEIVTWQPVIEEVPDEVKS